MRLTSKPDVLRLQAKRDVDGLVQALGYRADSRIQDAASAALIAIGEPSLPPLIRALASPTMQAPAIATLRKIGVLSIDPLINVLKTDERASVRTAAANTLADIGMFAIEPLISALVHRSPEVRSTAINALLAIGPLTVEPLISQLADKDHPAHVRIAILKALTQLGTPPATSAVLAEARNDPSQEVREYAAHALGRQDLFVKKVAPPQPQSTTQRPRGLSTAFSDKDKPAEGEDKPENKDDGTNEEEVIIYRWSHVLQALPRLQVLPIDVLQRLIRTQPVQRRHSKPYEVVEDLDMEFTQYSRLKDSAYADVSIRLVFDNEITQESHVMPATRELEVILVRQKDQYFVFLNATYTEHFW